MPRLFRPVLVLVNVTHIVFIYLGYVFFPWRLLMHTATATTEQQALQHAYI